jgi:hypothetical protein
MKRKAKRMTETKEKDWRDELKCANCVHYKREEGDTCGLDFGRCAAPIPFWIPLPVRDYRSWVNYSQGARCEAYSEKPGVVQKGGRR